MKKWLLSMLFFVVFGFAWAVTYTSVNINQANYNPGTRTLFVPTASIVGVRDPVDSGAYDIEIVLRNQSYTNPDRATARVVGKSNAASAVSVTGLSEQLNGSFLYKFRFAEALTHTPTTVPATATLTSTQTATTTATATSTATFIGQAVQGCSARSVDAEWVQRTADCGMTIAASQTSKAFTYDIGPFPLNETWTGFSLKGRITSAGNPCTIIATANYRVAESSTAIGPPLTITSSANLTLSPANANLNFAYPRTALPTDGRTYYISIVGTTGASCRIEMDGVDINRWSLLFPTPTP